MILRNSQSIVTNRNNRDRDPGQNCRNILVQGAIFPRVKYCTVDRRARLCAANENPIVSSPDLFEAMVENAKGSGAVLTIGFFPLISPRMVRCKRPGLAGTGKTDDIGGFLWHHVGR